MSSSRRSGSWRHSVYISHAGHEIMPQSPLENDTATNAADRFGRLLDVAPDAMLVAEPDGRIVLANAKAEALFGYAVGDMRGLFVESLIPENRRAEYLQKRPAYAAQPVPRAMGSQGELTGLKKDGTTFPAEVSLSPFDTDHGILICCAVRDITARRRVAAQLRASEERFRTLVDQSSDGIFISDIAGRYQDVNPAGCTMLGYARDELLRMSIADVLHPTEVPRLGGEVHRLRGGEPVTSEWRFMRKDGSTFFGEVHARQLSDLRIIANVRDVSARREVENELRAGQRFIAAVAKASPLVIYVFDLDQMRMTYTNRSTLADLGYPSSVQEVNHLDDLKTYMPVEEMPHLDRVLVEWRDLADGELREDEYLLRDADGNVHRFLGREILFARHRNGDAHQILGTLYDITTRTHAQEALAHNRKLLQSFVEHTPAAVAMLDRDLRYVVVSRRWLQDYGLGDRDLTGLHHYDVFPEIRNMPDWQRAHQHSLAGVVERRDRDPFVRANGRTDWLRWEARPWRDEHGAIGGIIMFTEVITESVLADARLRESQLHLLASQRVSGLGSWELDLAPGGERRQRSALRWSDQCFRVFGYDPGEIDITPDTRWALVHRDDVAAVRTAMRTAIERGVPYAIDYRIVGRDRTERTVHEQAELVHSPETGVAIKLIGTVQDVTDRLRLEAELRQSQKLQAIGQIAGGVAHDFNNALTVVGGVSEMLLDRLPAGNPARDDVMAIREAADHAASLTRQLLLFSRRAVLESRVIECNEVVMKTIRLLKRVIGEDKILSVDLGRALPSIKADPTQIEQVVMNLALNARDAMPQGGRLTIVTRVVSLTADDCSEQADYRPGRFVQITVSDTGGGMTPEVKSHVFEPFFTTKGPGKGTGLGLATVYGIVRESGGFISFVSEVGVGTTFKVFLPALDAVESVRLSTEEHRILRGTETVLVVEDDPNVRHIVRTILEGYGYTVLEASDGEAALRLAESHAGPIDLLLSDVVMPGIGGRELARTLTGRARLSRVLFMSGYEGESALLGSDAVSGPLLSKPFTPRQLATRVRDVLDQKMP
jgi:PAS domain S-box-containing protein